MKIIIAGGGKIGRTLVGQLSLEGYDITLIDTKKSVLEDAVDRFDVMGVQGNCASVPVLKDADIDKADLLIAAIGTDEVNLLCCMTAHMLNPNLHTIARIRNPEYNDQIFHMRDAFALSMVVNPEFKAAVEIERLLRYPGFLRRDSFAKDRAEIVELQIESDSPLANQSLSRLGSISKVKVLVCAVLRDGKAITPDGDFILRNGDRIFVTAPTSNLAMLLKNLGILTRRVKKVMICGGGRISYYLAQRLEKTSMDVSIVEKDYDRCLYLSEMLPKTAVICGDATNTTLMEGAGMDRCDAVVSLTNYDEMNLVISLYGGTLKIPQRITKLAHIENRQMFNNLSIGSVIDPKEICSTSIVRYVRALKNQTDAAISVHSFADGLVEAEEFRVDETSKHCGIPLKKLKLKKNVLIVCINHGKDLYIPDGNSVYEVGDTVVIVSSRENNIGRFNEIFEERRYEL